MITPLKSGAPSVAVVIIYLRAKYLRSAMKIGDLVRAKHTNGIPTKAIGLIVRIDANTYGARYWVKFCARTMGPYPFKRRQLEIISASR